MWSSAARFEMLIGVVGGLIGEGVERESDSLGALRARMVTAIVGLVADVLELAVCSAGKSLVQISTDGRWLELVGSRRLVGSAGTTERGVGQGRERGGW